jgi:hypothetical protein
VSPAKLFDRETILQAARDFAKQYGRPPTVLDWNVAEAKTKGLMERVERFYADGCWPHYGSVRYYFPEGWVAMIRLAGMKSPPIGKHYNADGEVVNNGGNYRGGGAPRTHCKRGHEFTPENTYVMGGARRCRTCVLAANRASYQRRCAQRSA